MKKIVFSTIILGKIRQLLNRNIQTNVSAVLHNSIENVDSLNRNQSHWLSSRESDKRFLDAIYHNVISLCAIGENKRIADYGCGTGVLVYRLKSDFPRLDIVGYDFSEEKIQRCREYYNIDPACFSSRSIYDAINIKYDVIIATEVLEHLDHPMKALRNLLSGLTVSGRLFVTVPDGRKDTYHGHIHFWSPESWSLFIHEAVGSLGEVCLGKLADKNYALITLAQSN